MAQRGLSREPQLLAVPAPWHRATLHETESEHEPASFTVHRSEPGSPNHWGHSWSTPLIPTPLPPSSPFAPPTSVVPAAWPTGMSARTGMRTGAIPSTRHTPPTVAGAPHHRDWFCLLPMRLTMPQARDAMCLMAPCWTSLPEAFQDRLHRGWKGSQCR